MLKNNILLYIILSSLCVCSCYRIIEKKTIPVFTKDFKSFALFNYGSNWVYIDSLTNAMDTITCSEVSFRVYRNIQYTCEMLSSKYVDKNLLYVIKFDFGVYNTNNQWTGRKYTLYRIYDPIDTLTRDSVQFVKKIDYYTLGARTFYDVYQYKILNDYYITDSLPGTNPSFRYYAPNVGLIRIEAINSNYVRNIYDYTVRPIDFIH